MQAGFEVFRAFQRDAKDFASTMLPMPNARVDRQKKTPPFLIAQVPSWETMSWASSSRAPANWLIHEAPAQVIPKLIASFSR